MSLVPAPALQIDIFVTNFKTLEHERQYPAPPVQRPVSTAPTVTSPSSYAPVSNEDTDQLLPPTPRFARQGRESRSNSIGSNASANSSVESFVDRDPVTEHFGDEDAPAGDLGVRENYTLDLTNFDGDDDDALPGEDALSVKVRKQGKALRAKTRKAQKAMAGTGKDVIPGVSVQRQYQRHARQESNDTVTSGPMRPISGHFEVDLTNVSDSEQQSPTHRPSSPLVESPSSSHNRHTSFSALVPPEQRRPHSFTDKDWDTMSQHNLMSQVECGIGELKLEVEDDDMIDMTLVAECARPGKPKLERILADEVEHSTGSTIVGC